MCWAPALYCAVIWRLSAGLWQIRGGLTGALTGTKRVSLLLEVGALDARKMASNRNMKISDSMFMLLARRCDASCERGLAVNQPKSRA